MSVATEKARIAAIASGYITDLKSAVAGVPRKTPGMDLPALVILTGEAARRWDGDLLIMERVYKLALLVMPWVQGIELEAEDACVPFFPRFEDVFAARPSLELAANTTALEGVQHAELGNDTGVIEIELAATSYAGVTFDLHVQSYRQLKRGI